MPTTRRETVLGETRLLAQYLAERWPAARTVQNIPLGIIPAAVDTSALAPEELRALSRTRRWVDAVIFLPAECILIEAGIVPDPGDLGKLAYYCRLWPTTPEYPEARDRRYRGLLVYALPDPVLTVLARDWGYNIELFRPPWVDEYLARLPYRARRPSRPQTMV